MSWKPESDGRGQAPGPLGEGAAPPRESGVGKARVGKRPAAEPTPTQRALALLVRREHSRKELARKLSARGVGAEAAEAAIARLADEGWQSEGRFAEMLVRTRAAQGYGPIRIRAELGTHGLDNAAVDAAMETFEGDWAASAHAQVQRRFGARMAADPRQRHKAAEFLYRRGFDGEVVRAALKAAPED